MAEQQGHTLSLPIRPGQAAPPTNAAEQNQVPSIALSNAIQQLGIRPDGQREHRFNELATRFYFSLSPEKSLPCSLEGEYARNQFCREITVQFLRRYGSVIWPSIKDEPRVPHLEGKRIEFEADSKLNKEMEDRYKALGVAVPAEGTWKGMCNSPLGLSMRHYFKVLLFGAVKATRQPDLALFSFIQGRDVRPDDNIFKR